MASYDEEFKKRIVRKHMGERRTIRSLSEKYHVSEKGIGYWLKKYREECSKDPAAKEEYDLMKENLKLRKELEEMKNENNFLKKAAARQLLTVQYIRLPELLTELAISRTTGTPLPSTRNRHSLSLTNGYCTSSRKVKPATFWKLPKRATKRVQSSSVPNLMYQDGGIRLARQSLQMKSVTASCMIPTEL